MNAQMLLENFGPVSYTHLDVYKRQDDVTATIERIEYDPNRSANIALVCYADGERKYIIAPKGLAVGMKIGSGNLAQIKLGDAVALRNIPIGTIVHLSLIHI